MPDTTPGPLAADLAAIRECNEQYIKAMKLTEWTVGREPCGDVRRLLGVLETALAELAKHQHKLTDTRGQCCAGCLSEWPCPSDAAISSALLGKDGTDG